ncbi:MAG: Rieske (2Fe-2S) protein [Chitinispirillaceae bacterium]|nr:Rieske (2Fe-2S) protein [Chitinispirillaceae bacterium]
MKHFFFFSSRQTGCVIGALSRYTEGRIAHDEKNRLLIGRDSRGLFAMSDVCTHRSCMLRLDNGRLRCPCHNAEFDFYGNPIKGPVERPLDRYYIHKNADGTLRVDPAKTVNSAFRYTE